MSIFSGMSGGGIQVPESAALIVAPAGFLVEQEEGEQAGGCGATDAAAIDRQKICTRIGADGVTIMDLVSRHSGFAIGGQHVVEQGGERLLPFGGRPWPRQRGEVLRYVARVSPGRIEVGPEAVSADSPLGRLEGTDNLLVSITNHTN